MNTTILVGIICYIAGVCMTLALDAARNLSKRQRKFWEDSSSKEKQEVNQTPTSPQNLLPLELIRVPYKGNGERPTPVWVASCPCTTHGRCETEVYRLNGENEMGERVVGCRVYQCPDCMKIWPWCFGGAPEEMCIECWNKKEDGDKNLEVE